jgi:hypothetical protein
MRAGQEGGKGRREALYERKGLLDLVDLLKTEVVDSKK